MTVSQTAQWTLPALVGLEKVSVSPMSFEWPFSVQEGAVPVGGGVARLRIEPPPWPL